MRKRRQLHSPFIPEIYGVADTTVGMSPQPEKGFSVLSSLTVEGIWGVEESVGMMRKIK